jgi:glycosyltransferase involved in cell wall biosynthesis
LDTKVSVIIPVYNAGKFLHECIKPLINQTLRECEFIFIDDGSQDNSNQIIQEYIRKDNRIKLIIQKNQGVSSARNKGLEKAKGEYIGFVDADDYIDTNLFEVLYSKAKKHEIDIIISNFEMELGGTKKVIKYSLPVETTLESKSVTELILPYFLEKEDLNSVCNKLFKNSLVKEKNIRFPKNVALGEDGAFNIQIFYYSKRVMYTDFTGYHYREVKGSATRNIIDKDYFTRALEVYQEKPPRFYLDSLGEEKIKALKSKKLVNSALSYIHLYLEPSQISFYKRIKYVKSMIHNEIFRDELLSNIHLFEQRYERLMVKLVLMKSTWGVFLLTRYSFYRNRNSGGITF